MKAAKLGQIEGALDSADPNVRMFLLYGPDEAGSRALAARLGKALPGAERLDLSGSALKADPARLADEAASMSLFGDARYIRVEPAGDEVLDAVIALLDAAAAGNPVVVVAGALTAKSKLVTAALAHPMAMAFASYPAEEAAANQIVATLAREVGLRVEPGLAQRLTGASNGDRATLQRELEKFALFLDADPSAPKELDHGTVDLLTADSEAGDLPALVDAALGGDLAGVDGALARMDHSRDAITALRALGRRVLLLAQLRSDVDGGNSISAVMTSNGGRVFWKDKEAVAAQLARWPSPALVRLIERVATAERTAKSVLGNAPAVLGEELIAIARQAKRGRS